MKTSILSSFGLLLLLILGTTACKDTVKGSGNVTTETYELPSFDKVAIAGMYELYLIEGKPRYELTIDDNLHEYVRYESDGNRLRIGSFDHMLDADSSVLKIYFEDLSEIEINGACQLHSEHVFKDRLAVRVNGASEMELALNVSLCEFELNGGAEVDLKGKAKTLDIDITGAAEVNAFALETDQTDVSITGAGEVKTYARKRLNVSIKGAGNVEFIGDPEVEQSIMGAGEVKKNTEVKKPSKWKQAV